MVMKRALLVGIAAAASVLFVAEGALADGYGRRGGLKGGCAPAFQGFYVGAHGGFASYTAHQNDLDAYFADNSGYTASDTGFTGGAQIGWNWQNCNALWGVEVDWSRGSLDATTRIAPGIPGLNFAMTSSVNSFGTLRTRTGLVVDNLLLYVTGGLAFADMDFSTRFVTAAVNERVSFGDTRWGWTAGFGTEWAVGSNISLKSEVLYLSFAEETHGFFSTAQGRGVTFTTTDSMWVTRVGVNVKFSCGGWC
jgi:outer membrane immunogenic protein